MTDGEPRPVARPAARRPCPICGKPASEDALPFCSSRCAKVDLNRWLSGTYVIPAAPDDDASAAEPEE